MSYEAKVHLMNMAWNQFPAQELWIRHDNAFWAFEWNDDRQVLLSTTGQYTAGDILYATEEIPSNDFSYHNLIEDMIQQKKNEGYECFASQLMV